jgi:hypothetical protein
MLKQRSGSHLVVLLYGFIYSIFFMQSASEELAKLKLEEEKLANEEKEWRKKEEELLHKEKVCVFKMMSL